MTIAKIPDNPGMAIKPNKDKVHSKRIIDPTCLKGFGSILINQITIIRKRIFHRVIG